MAPKKTQIQAQITPDDKGYVNVNLDVPTSAVVMDTSQTSAQNHAKQEEKKKAEETLQAAQQQLEEAKKQEQKAETELKQLKGEQEGKTVAGYKPADLLTALSKPPEPANNQSSVDPELMKQIEEQAKTAKEQVAETEKQIKEVEKQAPKTTSTAKPSEGLKDKFSSMISSLQDQESSSSSPKPHQAFLLAGVVFLIVAFFGMLFNKSMLVTFILLIAIAEILLGVVLKKKSQA